MWLTLETCLLYVEKLYWGMFDKGKCLWKHHHNENNLHIRHRHSFLLCLRSLSLPPPLHPHLRQPLNCLLALQMGLYDVDLYINGIMRYASIVFVGEGVRLAYFETHSYCCLYQCSPFLSTAKVALHCVDILQMICLHIDGYFGFHLLAMSSKAAENIHIQVFIWTHTSHIPFLLGKFLGMGCLNRMIGICLTPKKLPTFSSSSGSSSSYPPSSWCGQAF